ncbi:primosomal protein N' [Paroceanicella profunda]|uniref:Replication restart protein PriA n=1 Tax=Paroceanicella profunda TaxID=2579971 RepID=A0A5B8FGP3_9RHOB|nr:primosomal protein N' [Paroceanicella profunda]QDL91118.1 primosomal protein N' [Paroceanicella profunda]
MDGAEFSAGRLVAVLTTEPLDRLLDYKAPEDGVSTGDFVRVPLGPRQVIGVVWGPGEGGFDPKRIRSVSARMDIPPMLPAMRAFLERAAEYTLTPLPAMLRLATRAPGLGEAPGARRVYRAGPAEPSRLTPARARVLETVRAHGGLGFSLGDLSAEAGVSTSVIKGLEAQGVLIAGEAPRDPPYPELDAAHPGRALSALQAEAAETLRAGVVSGRYGTTLLKGVTGSGKTEVYLEAVAECLARGRQALVLLPEIALTVDFLDRVEARFGARPAEWHSGASMAERRRCWRAVAEGAARLVIGARSALFLPFRDLGLIIVDEEHDGSYKQEDGALYNARDMAVLRAALGSAQVVLASATPSLESWANAEAGKYARIDLPERFGPAVLPEMRAIDMRSQEMASNTWISPALAAAMRQRLEAREQSLLFLNRRGFAPLTLCRACGHQIGCTHCDARMVEHRFRRVLMCHQCGATAPIPTACPNCEVEGKLAPIGPGVERLAEEVAARFPEARVAILSSDLATTARDLKERIDEIASGAADIVIGTQLVAKGHNFPLLTLVGVIDADLGLQGGDLRAAEKTFQLVRQVAGRAGRAERPGLGLVQTHQPDHPVIRSILSGDEEAFWRSEAAQRMAAGAPPYGRMAGVVVSGPDEARTFETARALGRAAGLLERAGVTLFGPALAPVARIRGRTRVRLLLKAPKGAPLQAAARAWRDSVRPGAGVRVSIDIDPMSFF